MCIYVCMTFIFMYACVYMHMHIYINLYVYIGAAVKAERILEDGEEGKGVGRGRRGRGRAGPVCSATGRQVPVKLLYSGAITALLRRC
jgi:hypothetical protein